MKQGRIKIDKQIYSTLEEKIAKKLNFLLDKKLNNFFGAWQLTPLINTFGGDIDKKDQVGIMFYVNPNYTSVTCPKCGFRKRKYYKTKDAKEVLGDDVKISFDYNRYIFEFSSDLKKDRVYSNVRRTFWDWDKRANSVRGDLKEIADVTNELKILFNDFDVVINNQSLTIGDQVKALNLGKEREKEFWMRLNKWFNCILNIRNSISKKRELKEVAGGKEKIEEWGKEIDFICCPYCYFDSGNPDKWGSLRKKLYIGGEAEKVKFNGDANGAYNIGRKGILALKKIKEHQQEIKDFKKRWGIEHLPKDEKEKISFEKDDVQLTLNLTKLTEKNQREILYYCIFNKGEKVGKERKDMESVAPEKRLRKYPNLFISDGEWDELVRSVITN